jgi:hypothetical protein
MSQESVIYHSGEIKKSGARAQGLKARVAHFLETSTLESMTTGQIASGLGLSKADHADVASVLVKLRTSGLVRASLGPASAVRGRRYVKRYAWVRRVAAPAPRTVVVTEMELRRQLSFRG